MTQTSKAGISTAGGAVETGEWRIPLHAGSSYDSETQSSKGDDAGAGPIWQIRTRQQRSAFSGFAFAVLLAAVCFWILSLPLFPTQDEPMHRYYIHVLDGLLRHQSLYKDYQIRHPFPPYATHYAALLLLFHVFSYDLAEKLFACLIVLCVGYGLRFSARQIGGAGSWVALLCTPLLFAWPFMGGMLNYVLGVGLALLATGFWQRIPKHGVRSLAAFTAVLLVLTFTHPIPLLLLILLCCLDLTLSFLFNAYPRGSAALWLRERRLQAVALLFTLLAAVFPALAADAGQTHSTLLQFGLHVRLLGAYGLLYGLSPYNSRSHSFWINAYRLSLYLTYAGCNWAGGWATIGMFRRKQVNFGATIFVATLLLTVAVPFLPDYVNGSAHFADRLLIVIWLGALLAASAAPLPSRSRQLTVAATAAIFCLCTLTAAQIYIRPLAYQLREIEFEPLLPNSYGAIFPGYRQGQYMRYEKQLAFDPFRWAPALAFVRQNDIVLNGPFISQKITPLQAAPHSPLLVPEVDNGDLSKEDMTAHPGAVLPRPEEAQLVRDSSFIVYVATPEQLAQGLSERLSPAHAVQYQCGPSHLWYVVCAEKKQPAAVP